MIDNSDDENNFPHELLLTNRQVANLCKALTNISSTNIKLSKTQLSKTVQSGGFLGGLLGRLWKTGLPLIKNVIKPLAKSVLIPLGLTTADAGIHKKVLGSGTTTLMLLNDEIKDIMKMAKSLEDSALLLKRVSESIQNEAKEQKGVFLSVLLRTLGASFLRNMLSGKGINRAGYGSKDLQSKGGKK